jgi:septal ring factor EnvC (AmiA/AmiB activator)
MTKHLTINDTWKMGMSALKACKEHNETINKMATHVNELWKEIGLKQDRIKILEEQIQDKDFEIDDLNKAHSDQLWDLAKLEKENKELKEVCGGVAHYEKKIKEFIKKESVDN